MLQHELDMTFEGNCSAATFGNLNRILALLFLRKIYLYFLPTLAISERLLKSIVEFIEMKPKCFIALEYLDF